MKASEALRLATKLAAFYPGTPEATVIAYASMFEEHWHDLSRAEETVEWAVMDRDRFPSMAWLLEEYQGLAKFDRPALPPESSAPVEIGPVDEQTTEEAFAGYWEKFGEENRDPQARARSMLVNLTKEIPNEGSAEPEHKVPWPEGLPQTREPFLATNGPGCGMCGQPTVHDGGSVWFCPGDGWMQRRSG
jgi:hypothetical protein